MVPQPVLLCGIGLLVFFAFGFTSDLLLETSQSMTSVSSNSITGHSVSDEPVSSGNDFFSSVKWLFQFFIPVFTIFVIKAMGY